MVEIVKDYGVIGNRGATKLMLRKVKWNGDEPTYDIRPWYTDEDGDERYLNGLRLSDTEFHTLIAKGVLE